MTSKLVAVPKSTTIDGEPTVAAAAAALAMRSGPTSRGFCTRTATPVLTPGPTVIGSTPATRWSTSSHACCTGGTVVDRQPAVISDASIDREASRPRNVTSSSSVVR